uniref:Uncharacterized protein n=1 Tax=Avena sativa TaxID=4498 RepID=A0ACD5TZY9_AVESA
MPAPSASAAAPPIRPGAPHAYLKTHGAKVARRHMVDWIVLVLLAAVAVTLNSIEPFHRFVGKDMMVDLLYPLKGNTVPIWAVAVLAGIVPVLIFAGVYVRTRNAYDLHHAILGLLFSVLITAVVTEAIKNGVGRPRPDFYWRCFPDGVPNYNNFTGQVICHGDAGVIKEGHKSFPSGHTSWSFAGLGFLSWYLAGKIRVFDRGGHVAKLCIIILPLLLAAMVGVSRVDDYWHHWQDVFAGGILGLVVASFCYLQFFPSPSGENGHWPHAFHHHILNPEAENHTQPTTTTTATSERNQSISLHDLSIVPYVAAGEVSNTDGALDYMEAGSRAR